MFAASSFLSADTFRRAASPMAELTASPMAEQEKLARLAHISASAVSDEDAVGVAVKAVRSITPPAMLTEDPAWPTALMLPRPISGEQPSRSNLNVMHACVSCKTSKTPPR